MKHFLSILPVITVAVTVVVLLLLLLLTAPGLVSALLERRHQFMSGEDNKPLRLSETLVPANNEPNPTNKNSANLNVFSQLKFGTTGYVAVLKNSPEHLHFYGPTALGASTCTGHENIQDQGSKHDCIVSTNLSPFSYAKDAECESPFISDGKDLTPKKKATSSACFGMMRDGKNFLVASGDMIHKRKIEDGALSQLVCGFDFLVINGTQQYSKVTEIAPRTAVGVDKDGNFISLVGQGSEVSKIGLTLNQTAQWMKDLGAVYAANYDGGGSSTFYYNENCSPVGKTCVQGVPSGIDTFCWVLRSVQTSLCIK